MSLEAQLAELNKNVVALTAALLASLPAQAPTAAAPVKAPPAAPAPTPTPAAKATPTVAPTAPSLEQAQKLILEIVAKKGRETAITLLDEFKVKKASELKPNQVAAFVEEANAKLAV